MFRCFPKCDRSQYQIKPLRAYSPISTDSKYVIFNCRQHPELWEGWPEKWTKTRKKHNIPLIKEGIFLN